MKRWFPLAVLLVCAAFVPRAIAHEVRPAYLELVQTAPDTYDVLWKVPAAGDDRRLAIYVQFPPEATELDGRRGVFSGNASIERWSIRIAGGLEGRTIRIDGLSATRIDVLARVQNATGVTQTARMLPDAPSFVVTATPSVGQVSATYVRLGVEHILSGVDHLLYILAMLLVVSGWKRVVATMTAFTLTHSITLSAAALGYVHVPGPPVEAMIALSIVFVAREIVVARRGDPGLTHRWPWVISFTFGLLHGFGFAGALSEVGLPAHAIPFALLSFNVGVEIGQLLFVAAVLGLFAIARRVRLPSPAWVARATPYAIGSVAMFWVFQRVAAF
ncbi:MAG TPA: HupE/UreJ family protein [Planctomycetota bacterium]|jgi:hydrogenase/urease accessory protein HupE|nr:HupE/UreJ family protein [Planctomycetota bacterium]